VTWLDTLLDRSRKAKVATPKPSTPARVQAEPEIRSWWIQTAAPRPPDYAGAIEPLFYSVDDGAVTLCDEIGKAVDGKTMRIGVGNDCRYAEALNDAAARRLQPGNSLRPVRCCVSRGAPAAGVWEDVRRGTQQGWSKISRCDNRLMSLAIPCR